MRGKHISMIFVLFLLTGCAFKYPVVGSFDDYNEVFRGTVHQNAINGTGYIEVKGENTGAIGRGNSRVTYVPPFSMGGGQRGEANLEFDDGRIVNAFWHSKTLTSGFGTGHDQFGNTFKFVFGLSEQEAEEYIHRKKEEVGDKPELPPPYRPKEFRKSRGFSSGTGFFVSDNGHVLTNYHVVEDAKTITIKDSSGDSYQATFIKSDPANDVALLKIDANTNPLDILSYSDVAKGSEVFTLGFPLVQLQGQEQKATFGRVNALSGVKDDIRFLQIDVPLQPGNSGGALFDRSGYVVAVTTSTLSQVYTLKLSGMLPQNVNYAVKVDYIVPMLRGISTIQGKRINKERNLPDLIKILEKSVVMVITE